MSGVCEVHGPHSRKKCDGCKLDAAAARHFPERLLAPWREEVAQAGLEGWEARMQPLFGRDSEARYVLAWSGPGLPGVSVQYVLSGAHRGNLIRAALAFMEPRR